MMRILIVTLLSLIVILPDVSPVFSQPPFNVSSQVSDIDNDGYPEIIFTATDGSGHPLTDVTINVTLDGFNVKNPLYSGSINASGKFVLDDMPGGNYTWSSSIESNEYHVKIDPRNYPIEVSEKRHFGFCSRESFII